MLPATTIRDSQKNCPLSYHPVSYKSLREEKRTDRQGKKGGVRDRGSGWGWGTRGSGGGSPCPLCERDWQNSLGAGRRFYLFG